MSGTLKVRLIDQTIVLTKAEGDVYNILLDQPKVGRMLANNMKVETLDPKLFLPASQRFNPYQLKIKTKTKTYK